MNFQESNTVLKLKQLCVTPLSMAETAKERRSVKFSFPRAEILSKSGMSRRGIGNSGVSRRIIEKSRIVRE